MVDKSEKFNWFVRLGFFSRAILYSLVGIIALTSASKIAEGTNGVFRAIEDFPLGSVILWLMVFGLAAYGLFRLASFAFDIENHGSDAKGWGKRLGHAGSGIGHFALAFSAFQFANSGSGGSGGSSGGSGGGAQEAASGVLSVEFGGIVLGILGIAFFIAAANQAKKGVTASFMNRIAGSAPSYTKTVGRIGYLARAVVFGVIGWSVFSAGFLSGGSDQVKTLGDAVASLAGNGIIFTLVALGMLAFGILSLILARYRIIPDMGSDGKVPSFRT
ncbi:DUF1206 domain-containing protein [Aurantiacibacter gangjinensis]|uniref:Uncharacterized protein n=1 Tax=Aurantiacibacter gangjinensis TaxID=502682 RepID=A0A0G9MQ38_9SPHN|nr:DUF1206 domain-containing protein [Aurantiacibacter gangjinensis]APE28688.1 membrane protein, putative [Aurantiacibacter gangjinensis]KLE32852.1 hypothetical protein AAW01_02190 [Aurantiacibacter gangjinensis]